MQHLFRKLLTVFFSLLILLFSPSAARGESRTFLQVQSENAGFFSSQTLAEDSLLFTLTKGYFLVFVEELENGVLCVEFQENTAGYSTLVGFVHKNDVKKSDPKEPLYPSSFPTALISCPILQTPSFYGATVATCLVSQSVRYYGTLTANGSTWYFIRFGTTFGYVNAANFTPVEILPHPSLLEDVETSTPPIEEEQPVQTPNKKRGFLILLLTVPCVAIVVLMFKPVPEQERRP